MTGKSKSIYGRSSQPCRWIPGDADLNRRLLVRIQWGVLGTLRILGSYHNSRGFLRFSVVAFSLFRLVAAAYCTTPCTTPRMRRPPLLPKRTTSHDRDDTCLTCVLGYLLANALKTCIPFKDHGYLGEAFRDGLRSLQSVKSPQFPWA